LSCCGVIVGQKAFVGQSLLGMMLTLLGLFLVTPNAVTLLVLGLGVVLIQIQVRLEEEFLSNAHAEDYAEYRRGVRRWL
jgi:protein-S-isoprenylcysteine O-methyltransferase Ste14